jgi:hypothetical protein
MPGGHAGQPLGRTIEGVHRARLALLVAIATAVATTCLAARPARAGTIDLPPADTTIVAGDFLAFAASASDPDGEAVTLHWDFGGAAAGRDVEDPGPIQFCRPGRFTVTLMERNAGDLGDPSPAMRVVTVIDPLPGEPAHEVHWTFTGQTSVTVDWRGGSSSIRYGLTTCYDQVATAVEPVPLPFSSPGPFREARLTGLLENALYHYSIDYGPDHTFRTPLPRGSSDFDVYVTADVGSTLGFGRVSILASLIAAGSPRFCLVPGDLTYAAPVQGQAVVGQHFDDVMVWSQEAAYMPAWGNHEWGAPAADDLRNYKGRFDFPNPQTSPGSSTVSCCGEDWYWFDYGNARFIAYPEPWSGALSNWYAKAKVLMDEAEADPAIRFVVTFGHRPAYSSGQHPGLAQLKGYLDALGASHRKYLLNLNGHSHNYERTHPLFHVTHVTAGAGGAALQENLGSEGCQWSGGCPPPVWTAFRALHHDVLKLHFGPDAIEGWAVCGPPDRRNDIECTFGSPMDHFVIDDRDHAPVVAAPIRVAGVPDQELRVRVTALEPDGEPMQPIAADLSSLPAGTEAAFSLDPGGASGTLTWTPSAEQVGGPYRVRFTAANGLAGEASTELLVTGQMPPKSLIFNPSFEGSMRGWVASDGSTVARVPGGFGSGWCAEVTGGATLKFGLNDSPNWIDTTEALGTRYRFSAWLRSPAGIGRAYFRVREYVGDVQQGSSDKTASIPLGLEWRPVVLDHVTRATGSWIDFRILYEASVPGESFEVDSVSCVVLANPSTTVSREGAAAGTTGEADEAAAGSWPLVFSAAVWPSPVVDRSILRFTTTRPGPVTIALYGVDGRRIRTLMDESNVAPGRHELDLRARAGGLMPGVYFYRLHAGEGLLDGRFVVLR